MRGVNEEKTKKRSQRPVLFAAVANMIIHACRQGMCVHWENDHGRGWVGGSVECGVVGWRGSKRAGRSRLAAGHSLAHTVVRMSESPAFRMESTPTRKYLPQAVPKSMLSARASKERRKKNKPSPQLPIKRAKTGRGENTLTSSVVEDLDVAQHGVVLDLGAAQGRRVL